MDIIHVTKDTFDQEIIKSDIPVLVDFWASWCGPCRMLEPIIHEVADTLPQGKAKICKINIDEQGELAMRYKVASIPTLVLFKDGGETARKVGFQTKDAILAFIQ